MWSPNELLKIEKQRDILSYITLQFFHFKKVPLEHCPFGGRQFFRQHRTIWQEDSARIFVPIQSLKNGGILYVFPIFRTEEVGQKDG